MSRLNRRHPLSPAADRSLQFLPMEQTLQDLRDSRSLLLLRRIPTGCFQQPSPLSIDLPYLRQTIHFFRCPVPAPPFQEPMQSFLKILPQTVKPEFLPKTPPEKADLPVLLGFLYSRYHRPLHKRLPQKKVSAVSAAELSCNNPRSKILIPAVSRVAFPAEGACFAPVSRKNSILSL